MSAIDALIHTNARTSIKMHFNMSRAENHAQIVPSDALIDNITGSSGNNMSNDGSNEDERDQAPSRSETLRTRSVVKHYSSSRDLHFNSLYSKIFTLQRRLREEKVKLL